MRKTLFLLLFSVYTPLASQAQGHLEIPRYEAGIQFDINHLDGVDLWGGGAGVRFHYNFSKHLALDSELTFRQHDIALVSGALLPTPGVIGQTTGLFGFRAGTRVEDSGFFAHARAGFLHFGSDNGATLLSRRIFPARSFFALNWERWSSPTGAPPLPPLQSGCRPFLRPVAWACVRAPL